MGRLEKKCLIVSTGMHGLLLVLLVVGTAFLPTASKKPVLPSLKVIPTKLIDGALSGGGGNPNLAPSEAQQKGQTLIPQPVQTQPGPAPPTPRVEPKKPEQAKPVKEQTKEPVKPSTTAKNNQTKTPPLQLNPIIRPRVDKNRAKAEAEARARAEANRRLAKQVGKTIESLKSGFSQGTAVEVPGPGGEAYADYAQFVKSVYEDAWHVTDDFLDEDSTAKVTVTIARDGRVLSARIERRSGNSVLDKSVQRALDNVKSIGRPFPEGAKEDERTFTINFNLKAKRLLG